jgi:hypothetical protein
MNCIMVAVHRKPQECIEDNCYFWDTINGKCKWLTKK